MWLALTVVRLVVWVSTKKEDHGNAESMGTFDGCDGILEVLGDPEFHLGGKMRLCGLLMRGLWSAFLSGVW